VSFRSRVLRSLIAAIVATMLVLPTGAGAADPQSNQADRAVQLQPSKPLTGVLPPAPPTGSALSNNGAGLAYYKFEYSGDDSLVTINMQVYPDDESILADNKVGFVVYGPRTAAETNYTYTRSGAQPKKQPNISGDFRSRDRGSYLIQVYSDARVRIDYSVWADGLPTQPASAALTPVAPATGTAAGPAPQTGAGAGPAPQTGATAGPSPQTAASASPPSAPAPTTGDAASSGAGADLARLVPPVSVFGSGWSVKSTSTQGSNQAVRVHAVEYVAGDQDNPSAAVIVGVYAAQNDAAREAILPAIRSTFEPQGYTFTAATEYGDRAGLRATATRPPVAGLLRAFQIRNIGVAIIVVVPSDRSAEGDRLLTALAQSEQTAISQALGGGGAGGGQTIAAGGSGRLTAGAAPVKGTLTPGQFVLLQVDYPGDESVYTVNAQIDPDDPALLEKAGFQVFQPSGTLQVKGGLQPKLRPNVSADIISRVPGAYTVKVLNDNPNAAVTFEVTLATKAPEKK
jgi:hypothetical protein